MEWGSYTLDVATVYAPARPLARVDFISGLRNRITEDTIIGGDWNTVTDKTLDVKSRDPLGYDDRGGRLLSEIMIEKQLVDERREQLGNDAEYTRIGTVTGGHITSTRIDRWYVPEKLDYLWTFETTNDYIFKK